MTVILDPAPARALPAELYAATDIITPNETEAAALVGFAVQDQQSAERAGRALLDRGVRAVVIKMGSKGVYWSDGGRGGFAGPGCFAAGQQDGETRAFACGAGHFDPPGMFGDDRGGDGEREAGALAPVFRREIRFKNAGEHLG